MRDASRGRRGAPCRVAPWRETVNGLPRSRLDPTRRPQEPNWADMEKQSASASVPDERAAPVH